MLGASRMSSVSGLNASPSSAIGFPRSAAEVLLELRDHAPLLQLVDLDHRRQELEVVARVRGELLERERVLGEARAAVADPGAQEVRAEAVVEPDALGDLGRRRRPVSSQTFAISLMKLIRVIRNAFAASLIISAELTSQRTTGASRTSR